LLTLLFFFIRLIYEMNLGSWWLGLFFWAILLNSITKYIKRFEVNFCGLMILLFMDFIKSLNLYGTLTLTKFPTMLYRGFTSTKSVTVKILLIKAEFLSKCLSLRCIDEILISAHWMIISRFIMIAESLIYSLSHYRALPIKKIVVYSF
jgi:hypothetical protein